MVEKRRQIALQDDIKTAVLFEVEYRTDGSYWLVSATAESRMHRHLEDIIVAGRVFKKKEKK